MIRYPVDPRRLFDLIEQESATWLRRAGEHTLRILRSGAFTEVGAPEWSEIKPVLMKLQHNKCAYCERRLEGPRFGRIEHDVEHVRAKKAVKGWPHEGAMNAPEGGYPFFTGGPYPPGYPLLAWNPLNYAVACKTCNTPLKSNYFPIAGGRISGRLAPQDYEAERPYLLNPLGVLGPDPRDILCFDGIMARPRAKAGHVHEMGLVLIDFFQLNARETLRRQRAEVIVSVFVAQGALRHTDPNQQEVGERALRMLRAPTAAHSACAQDFLALLRSQPVDAERRVRWVQEMFSDT